MPHILIVEDETIIRSALRRLLERNQYQVSEAGSVQEAQERYSIPTFDLIVSDLRLPGAPGTELIKLAEGTPVLIMTSYASLRSAVDSMKMGAVDYIAKPFSPRELMARIKALLRRAEFRQPEKESGRRIRFADWVLDTLSQHLLNDDGSEMDLTGSDFLLLSLFLQHPGQVMDRDSISDATRGRETLPMERGIDVQISRLRQKLGDNGKSPRIIKTIRGSGYMLIAEVHEIP